jgi:tetratricopeptide (TPR) repeat protein
MKWVDNLFRFGLLLLISICCFTEVRSQVTSKDNHQSITLPEHGITVERIDSIFSLFNTFDYIRSGNTKEEVVDWLIQNSEKLHYNSGIARGKNLKGVLLRDRSEYDEAIQMHLSALNIAGNDTIILIYSLNNLGVAYRRLDKPRIALDYHLKALNLSEKFKGDPLIAKRSTCVALNSIGNINQSLNQPEQALGMFKRSLLLEKDLMNDLGVAINLQNIGNAYQIMGKIDTAITYFRQSLQYNEKVNSTVGRSICLNSIGEYYLQKEQPIEALAEFNKALVFAEKSNDNYYISQIHANLGRVYIALGRYDYALPQIEKFNKLSLEINSGLLIKDSYHLLSEYYEKNGQPALALKNLKMAISVNDSIVNEKNSRYLNELQTLYEADKKQQQIGLLTAENEIKNQRAIMLLILVGAIILISILIYFSSGKRNMQQKTELELKLFRSQMDPHFIFNALGSIQSFMYQNEPAKAASYLGQFSSLTRSILKNSSRELVPLGEELDTLRNYLEIEKMRKRDCFDYEIVVDENIETDFIYVPPIMIQPFAENSILHGFLKMECNEGFISIKAENHEDHITISISDNGIGINTSLKNKINKNHQSLGLKIFKDRIRLIEKKYKKTINFEILDISEEEPEKTGTRVTIHFPIFEPDDQSRNYRRRT